MQESRYSTKPHQPLHEDATLLSPPELSPVRAVSNDGAAQAAVTERVAKKAAPFDVHATHRCLRLGTKQRRGGTRGAAYNNNNSNNRYFDCSRHPTERATPSAVRRIERWSVLSRIASMITSGCQHMMLRKASPAEARWHTTARTCSRVSPMFQLRASPSETAHTTHALTNICACVRRALAAVAKGGGGGMALHVSVTSQ
jgi:hypothetical protein